MKTTVHFYLVPSLLMVVGVLLWIIRAQLMIIAWCAIAVGAIWMIGALWKHFMPAVNATVDNSLRISQQKHDHQMQITDKLLLRELVAYARERDLDIDLPSTIRVTTPVHPRIVDEKPPMPALQQPQQALLTGPSDECLNLSHDYQPHADVILSQRGMIVGVSGSGKSNSMATLHEELGRLYVPFLLIDTENEYGSLCNSQYLPRGQRFDVSQVRRENAKDFGWYLIENHVQAVLDVTSYAPDEAAYVVVNALAGLQQWEEELENEDRLSFMVTLSEAGAWFPQSSKAIPYSAQAYNELQTSFFTNLVPRGRKRGLGLVFDLQKPAQVDKRLMQTSWKILHRQTEPREIEMYKTLASLTQEEIVSLGNGEAYIFSSQVSRHRTQIRMRYTKHEANTPGLESIRRRQYNLSNIENFGRNSEIPVTPRNAFVDTDKPFRLVPKVNTDELGNKQTGVPEATKQAIVDLYREGMKRTDIQLELDLNGDEYWMIKQACDEYDQQRRRA